MNLTFQCSKDATLAFCLGDVAAADVMTTMLECVKMMIRIIKANIVKCLETSKCGFCVELWLRMVNQVKSLQTEKLISKRKGKWISSLCHCGKLWRCCGLRNILSDQIKVHVIVNDTTLNSETKFVF